MDIKDLNKTQLILLTLLITFVVSIATGIVTVSLMQKMPKAVTQTINNVIQRTIEKVSTVPAPTNDIKETDASSDEKNPSLISGDGSPVVSIYTKVETAQAGSTNSTTTPETPAQPQTPKKLGDGVIISDVGLILVDASILPEKNAVYSVTLKDTPFDVTVLEKFGNGFAILKISPNGTGKVEEVPSTDPKTPETPAQPQTPTPATTQ
jgi:hypothetical protein